LEVVYQGIRLTPEHIVAAAREEDVHLVGLSVLSGSHLALVTEILERMKAAGLGDVPVVVGGIIPPEDAEDLKKAGVAAVYTPKDYDLTATLTDLVEIVERAAKAAA
ncbi:MAG: cobalamin-dependent protein, partial [Proteobacteria bacterium]|nr:cobalamin-dependent protein [Pseudomonadota bacterium]